MSEEVQRVDETTTRSGNTIQRTTEVKNPSVESEGVPISNARSRKVLESSQEVSGSKTQA